MDSSSKIKKVENGRRDPSGTREKLTIPYQKTIGIPYVNKFESLYLDATYQSIFNQLIVFYPNSTLLIAIFFKNSLRTAGEPNQKPLKGPQNRLTAQV